MKTTIRYGDEIQCYLFNTDTHAETKIDDWGDRIIYDTDEERLRIRFDKPKDSVWVKGYCDWSEDPDAPNHYFLYAYDASNNPIGN